MNLEQYISSGIIEDYCLGLLSKEQSNTVMQQAQMHGEVQKAINDFMESLGEYALNATLNPPAHVKENVLNLISNLSLEEEKNVAHLPMLNKYSDHQNWLHIVEPVLPVSLDKKMFVHEIRNDEKVSQTVIWTHIDYPDEVHEDVRECFIILRGKCRCYIEDRVVELEAGGFLEIPMYAHHNVEVLGNDPVLAVVQRVKVA